MKAKHPPQANPNRGYSYVGQENIAAISGFGKGDGYGPGTTKDVKVCSSIIISPFEFLIS
jgi:hypothetical protein